MSQPRPPHSPPSRQLRRMLSRLTLARLSQLFRPRGWLLLSFAVVALFLAAVLGRRDLLTLAIFCFVLPAVAYASLHFFKSGFTLRREVSPLLGHVGETVEVNLAVHGRNPGGSQSRLVEELPPGFGAHPVFTHPQPTTPRSARSDHRYTILPSRRGVFTLGPLHCTFTDPFGVASLQRGMDDGARLTIAPAAVELPAISVTEGHGQDGSQATPELAHAQQDDLMTRDYRHGDPLRRVHWAVTARQGKLMVRAEESVTAPEAALVLDRRPGAFGPAALSSLRLPELLTTAAFETAIVAAVSIATHLLDRNFTLTLLDHRGLPALLSSPSAMDPDCEEFSGESGSFAVAAGLAALELAGSAEAELTSELARRLHDGERRGPVIAVVGELSEVEALLLAGTVESMQSAYAFILCQDSASASPAAKILRRAGWQVSILPAAATMPAVSVVQAWSGLDSPVGAEGAPS